MVFQVKDQGKARAGELWLKLYAVLALPIKQKA